MTLVYRSEADVLRYALIAKGLGILPIPIPVDPWSIYASAMPADVENCISVRDTTGLVDAQLMNGVTVEHPGVQIRIRASDPMSGFDRIKRMRIAVGKFNQLPVTIDGHVYTINSVTWSGNIIPMGQEQGYDRFDFVMNGMVSMLSPADVIIFDLLDITNLCPIFDLV